MLEQFVERLRSLLINPNALVCLDDVIYLYTKECEFVAFDFACEKPK
jgi:hypothetical protein